jgi:hypothetical protein
MIWKPVLHLWEVNELGHVRNIKTKKLLKLRTRRDGYLDIKLSYKRYLVHRLVATAFIPNPTNLPQVNHIDGNRSNTALSNLEWCDQFLNMKHAIKTGLFPDRAGERNGRATITIAQVLVIKDLLKGGWKPRQIAYHMKINIHTVYNLKRGLTWNNVD